MLTDERIDEIVRRISPELFKSNILYLEAFHAIEAEVRGEAQEPVAWFAFADSNGPVPVELWGFDQKACKNAVLENARSVGWKGTVEGYLLNMEWTIRPLYTAPQSPAPCPDCVELDRWLEAGVYFTNAEYEVEVKNLNALQAKVADLTEESEYYRVNRDISGHAYLDMLRQRNELVTKVAELEKEVEVVKSAARYHATQTNEVSVVVAEQSAEIFVLKQSCELKDANLEHRRAEIKQQSERIAELERSISTDTETIVRLHEKVAQQASLIEKCEVAMKSSNYDRMTEALEAIAEHKKGDAGND